MTIRGSINRWKRKRGGGIPLYSIDDREIHYQGIDHVDRKVFDYFLLSRFKFEFHYGYDVPDWKYPQVVAWTYANATAPYHQWGDGMFVFGGVRFSSEDDAFAFRMAFSGITKSPVPDRLTIEFAERVLQRYGLA